ncbi:hypothetical protein [Bradyrhizobium japonicum]|uniref:hypothetical protein n=1 Tax=Bradyrhizobium japonicum TaxID=375 RepID=UPI001BAD8B34|nr:hypothetical protein [Bradyrhizobium japonicum]MBR0961351.1 hypothetical protein [Bradyrhizobium japonicum]
MPLLHVPTIYVLMLAVMVLLIRGARASRNKAGGSLILQSTLLDHRIVMLRSSQLHGPLLSSRRARASSASMTSERSSGLLFDAFS